MLLLGATGLVQNAGGSEQPDSNAILSIGPGVAITGKPYAGMDATIYPIPPMLFTCGRFYISGATAGYRLLADETWTFDTVGKWRFDGYEADDSDELAGMHNRRQTVDIGGEFSVFGDPSTSLRTGWGILKVTFLTDALGQHDGQEMRITYAKPFDVEKLRISPSIGLAWLSNNCSSPLKVAFCATMWRRDYGTIRP